MADNVDITAGSGTTIATDDCTTGQVQLVKLAYGADGDRTQVAADADGLLVNLGANNDVTAAQLPSALDSNGGMKIGGCTAHDAVDAGAPVKIGLKAIAHGANPTAVAAADRTDIYANRHGIQFFIGGHPNIVTSRATYSASAQTDTAIGPGTVNAGTKVVVTQVQVLVSNPTTATPAVRVGFGAANTPTTTGVVLCHPGIPGGGGVSRGDGSGILGIGADGEELRITADAATGGVLDVLVSYFTIES
jgi:hypothetical protein